MKILVLNSGSSSLKYKLIDMPAESVLAYGVVESIGETNRKAIFKRRTSQEKSFEREVECPDHRKALEIIVSKITDDCISSLDEIAAVGHRVVHGKDHFSGPTLIDAGVIAKIKEFAELAPLHQPANISCIEACIELLPNVPQIAHFDTSFYRTMPKHSYLYPVPMEWHEKHGVRRYGFHGTSHHYVTLVASEMLGIPPEKLRLITAHLGNGASITAFKEGAVLDTSMGFTPLEGLMMGTRVGYLDPAVIPYISAKTGASVGEIIKILNNESGLHAISGIGRDMRNILDARAAGDERADLAIRMFVHTLRKYIGAYRFAMGALDAIVFTGGIGENSFEVRAELFSHLEDGSIILDKEKNKETIGGKAGFISAPDSPVKLLVIPTNEELMIARETFRIVKRLLR